MPYRFNGVECDTVEELRALTGYPMNQVLASNKELVANTVLPKAKASRGKQVKECVHKWKYDGHGGGHQGQYVHKCTKCGASDWFSEPLQ